MNLIREAYCGYAGRTFLREAVTPEVTDDGYVYASNIDREDGFLIMSIRQGREYGPCRSIREEPISERFPEYGCGPSEIPIFQYALYA